MNTEYIHKPIIVLDAGKVLVDFDLQILLNDLSRRAGKEIGTDFSPGLKQLFSAVYTGERHPDDIRLAVNAALHLSIKREEWSQLWCAIFTGEVPGMREALSGLRQEFRFVALSNTDGLHWAYLLETFPIFRLLEGWILSHEAGRAKPDPAVYRMLQHRYCNGHVPVYYTDDIPAYVDAARRLGWRAEVFQGADHFESQVSNLR